MWSSKLKAVVDRALSIATDCSHEYVTIEHLLLALMDEEEVLLVFINCNVNVIQLQSSLNNFLHNELYSVTSDSQGTPKLTIGVKKMLERVLLHAKEQQKSDVDPVSVLLEIFSERDSHAVYFLHAQNLSCADVIDCLTDSQNSLTVNYSDLISPLQSPMFNVEYNKSFPARSVNSNKQTNVPALSQQSASKDSETSILQQHSINLNAKATANQLEPVLKREEHIADVMRILCCKNKNNVILVGEPGVGKTAIAEGLAMAIVSGTAPKMLSRYIVYSLDIGSVLAGTKYRGDFEERIKTLMIELRKLNNIILFIDEIHSIIGAGATNGSSLDASNLLKPILAQGTIRCIGTTTYKEYNQVLLRDKAFLRRFHKIDILAPSLDDTTKILMGVKHRYEQHYSIKYTPCAITEIVKYADRYMSNHTSNMPDKAVVMLDEVGAYFTIQNQDNANKASRVIKAKDVAKIISVLCRTPIAHMLDNDIGVLLNMEKTLKQSIFGQDHAISIVCDKMKIAKLGLQSTSRPIGCFLFYGPTGVGKTELAKQLANSLQIKLLRFDMSEYSESHSVSRIVGSPPGYVGFEQGGLLTDAVYHNQHCVLLLDEMEKAHHNIYNMLLQIMDRGIITDSSGREVNFTHSVIIMTTNLGSESFERNAIGFNRQDNDASIKDIEKFFSPEFRNRLSAIIKFNGLTPLSVELIVEKSIGELQERLKARSVELVVDRSVVRHVVEKNKSMKNGARFIDAFVSNHIAKPIADVIIEQASCKNMVINIAAVGDSISINIEKRVSQRQKAKQVQKIRAESE